MLAQLMDIVSPTQFPALSSRPQDWTGDALAQKLATLDMARPSHRAYALQLKGKLESLLKNTWEYQVFGGIGGMQSAARRNQVSVVCKDYLIDYAEVAALAI